MITYADACRVINDSRGEAVSVTTMTQTKYWNQISTEPDLDVGIANAMSKASSVALGVALGDTDRSVLCLDSDGSLLMNFGTLATIAGLAPQQRHLFDNRRSAASDSGGRIRQGRRSLRIRLGTLFQRYRIA
jgi:thiamine pyrophosphate-dependent acetolactate synthase large subunit-like protein